ALASPETAERIALMEVATSGQLSALDAARLNLRRAGQDVAHLDGLVGGERAGRGRGSPAGQWLVSDGAGGASRGDGGDGGVGSEGAGVVAAAQEWLRPLGLSVGLPGPAGVGRDGSSVTS